MLYDDECECCLCVQLWDCHSIIKRSFMEELSHLLGSKFSSLDSVEKTSYSVAGRI